MPGKVRLNKHGEVGAEPGELRGRKVGLAKDRLIEMHTGEVDAHRLAVDERRAVNHSLTQSALCQVRQIERGDGEIGTRKVCLLQSALGKSRARQVGPREVGLGEDALVEGGVTKVSPAGKRPTQITGLHEYLTERGSNQSGSREGHLGQNSPIQLGTREIGTREVEALEGLPLGHLMFKFLACHECIQGRC